MTFIAFEGGEGAGKSTQIQMVADMLRKMFPERTVITTREPGGTSYAEQIRTLLLDNLDASNASALTKFGLLMASRTDHIHWLLKPRFDAGAIILCDRFVGSSWAYQLYGEQPPIPLDLFEAHYRSLAITPSLTILFDIDPEIGVARAYKRRYSDINHFDREGLEFHQRVRIGYLEYAKKYPSVIVDASRTIEEVYVSVSSHVVREVLATSK